MSSVSDDELSTDASDMEDGDRSEKSARIQDMFERGQLKLKTELSVPGSYFCPFCPGKKPQKSFNSLLGHAGAESRFDKFRQSLSK